MLQTLLVPIVEELILSQCSEAAILTWRRARMIHSFTRVLKQEEKPQSGTKTKSDVPVKSFISEADSLSPSIVGELDLRDIHVSGEEGYYYFLLLGMIEAAYSSADRQLPDSTKHLIVAESVMDLLRHYRSPDPSVCIYDLMDYFSKRLYEYDKYALSCFDAYSRRLGWNASTSDPVLRMFQQISRQDGWREIPLESQEFLELIGFTEDMFTDLIASGVATKSMWTESVDKGLNGKSIMRGATLMGIVRSALLNLAGNGVAGIHFMGATSSTALNCSYVSTLAPPFEHIEPVTLDGGITPQLVDLASQRLMKSKGYIKEGNTWVDLTAAISNQNQNLENYIKNEAEALSGFNKSLNVVQSAYPLGVSSSVFNSVKDKAIGLISKRVFNKLNK